MNSALHARITQLHYQFQHELLPLIERDFDERLSPVLQRIVRTLECVQIERFVPSMRGLPGRPQRDRQALARASAVARRREKFAVPNRDPCWNARRTR